MAAEQANSAPSHSGPSRSAFELFLSGELAAQAEGSPKQELKAGDLCPICQRARLDYDSLLNLGCPDCGYALAGCFT